MNNTKTQVKISNPSNSAEVYFDDGADFFGHGRLVGQLSESMALVDDGFNGVRAIDFSIIKPLTIGK